MVCYFLDVNIFSFRYMFFFICINICYEVVQSKHSATKHINSKRYMIVRVSESWALSQRIALCLYKEVYTLKDLLLHASTGQAIPW